jgi:hypothetical protein
LAQFGQFGGAVAGLRKTHFFDWFQLEPVGGASGAGETVFRPSGEAFHALVSLTSRADADGRLTGLSLNVARSFIDDARQGAFARDVVKSFLEAVSGGAAAARLLADEIVFRPPNAAMIVRGQGPQLSGEPSAAYLAFAGRRRDASLDLSGVTLSFANLGAELVVRATPRAGGGGWLSRLFGRG